MSGDDVLPERLASVGPVGAVRTGEGLLSRVREDVAFEVLAPAEQPVADVAGRGRRRHGQPSSSSIRAYAAAAECRVLSLQHRYTALSGRTDSSQQKNRRKRQSLVYGRISRP